MHERYEQTNISVLNSRVLIPGLCRCCVVEWDGIKLEVMVIDTVNWSFFYCSANLHGNITHENIAIQRHRLLWFQRSDLVNLPAKRLSNHAILVQ